MDVREKLALSVCNATQKTNFKCEFNCEKKGKCAYCLVMADQMIANGVTVQEWISVTERLPNHWEDVLVRLQCGDCVVAVRSGLIWRVRWNNTLLDREPTHWMPLPEPPKGE